MVNEYLLESLKEEGKRLGIPLHKNRALIREYLQSKILYYLYQQSLAEKISFIGGTSLRILRDLDRFSEDLDFDSLGLSFPQIKALFGKVKNNLEKEGFEIEYKFRKTNDSGIGEMKFKNLLYQLKISSDLKENLIIKINYTTPKRKPDTEVSILSRFGLVQSVITNTQSYLFSQKIRAVLKRKDPQPRDFYDIVWFLSHKIEPNKKLFPELRVRDRKELFLKLEKIYQRKIKPKIKGFKKRLTPFLIDAKKVSYLDIFGNLMKQKSFEDKYGKRII